MATMYNARRISQGKKGTQVVLTFNGRSVTRHLTSNNFGNHPDDAMPKRHLSLSNRIAELALALAQVKERTDKAEIALLDPTFNLKSKAEVAKALPIWRAQVLTMPDEINLAERALHALRASDPLQVKFNVIS